MRLTRLYAQLWPLMCWQQCTELSRRRPTATRHPHQRDLQSLSLLHWEPAATGDHVILQPHSTRYTASLRPQHHDRPCLLVRMCFVVAHMRALDSYRDWLLVSVRLRDRRQDAYARCRQRLDSALVALGGLQGYSTARSAGHEASAWRHEKAAMCRLAAPARSSLRGRIPAVASLAAL